MNIALIDQGIVVELTTTTLTLANYQANSILLAVDLTGIAPVTLGNVYNGTSFGNSPAAVALQYRSFTYVTFMEALSLMPVRAAAVIRQKNTDTDIGAHLELLFEVLKANDGIDFNNEISRTNFNTLVILSIFTSAERDTIVNNPNYVAP
jgi:hypothetical protein